MLLLLKKKKKTLTRAAAKGTGSILDALRKGKPLITVVNTNLMDNHQEQVAGSLAKNGHLIMSTPDIE